MCKDVPCADGGRNFPPHVMDFDHVEGEKASDVSQLVYTSTTRALREEVAKCEVVCANCHRDRTQRRSPVLWREEPTVGTAGLEPAASCPQSRRATKLRYVPLNGRPRILLRVREGRKPRSSDCASAEPTG